MSVTLRVSVRLFAGARERAGADAIEVEVPEPFTVAALRRALAAGHPELAARLPACRVAVDLDFAGDASVLAPGVEVALVPPVSGG